MYEKHIVDEKYTIRSTVYAWYMAYTIIHIHIYFKNIYTQRFTMVKFIQRQPYFTAGFVGNMMLILHPFEK